jgi:hypothetical protein
MVLDTNPVFRQRRPAVPVPLVGLDLMMEKIEPGILEHRLAEAHRSLDDFVRPIYKAISRHRRRHRRHHAERVR